MAEFHPGIADRPTGHHEIEYQEPEPRDWPGDGEDRLQHGRAVPSHTDSFTGRAYEPLAAWGLAGVLAVFVPEIKG